jgi:NAD(P)-dependent dehydrogenase (short-subunit alcohol dehydrogenase family)
MLLENKVAAITGSTAGIGRGIAAAFLSEGANVVINGRNQERGDKVLAALGAGDRCIFCQGDAAQREDIDRLITTAVERYGRIDILVNNAGGGQDLKPIVETTDESWDYVIKWNLYSTFWGTRAALRHMIPQQSGRIINVSSVEGKQGKPVLSSYCASKHGINGLTKTAALEVGTQGITVNSICPGLVITDIVRDTGPATAAAMGITYDEMIGLYTQESALKRPITVEEVAALAVLLASDGASGITGAIYSVDGGTAGY